MIGRWRLHLVPSAALLVACAGPQAATLHAGPARDFYAEAVDANARNNFVEAYAAARYVPADSADAPNAKALAEALLPRIDKLQARLLQKADDAVTLGFAAKGANLYAELLAKFPLQSGVRAEIEKKQAGAIEQVQKLRIEYDNKLKFAQESLKRGDALDAYRALSRASDIAEEQGFAWTFVEEQQLELARAELPPAQRTAATKHASFKRRRRATLAAPQEAEAIVGTVDTFTTQEQEISRLKSVRDLVERARDFRKRGMLYEAIVTLEEARRKDPEANAVKLLLESLEEDRGRLVEEYLEIADRFFAKQDLEAAVPYFRRVLKLEPDNLRAKEAVQMHQNLEKIKQERGESGR